MDVLDYIGTESGGEVFEDVYGREFWKKILGGYLRDAALDAALGMGTAQTVLLYGPFGAGKTLLLGAQAGEMVSAGYQYLEIDFRMMPDELLPQLADTISEHWLMQSPCYLRLFHPELLTDASPLYDLCNLADEKERCLIVATATEDVEKLDPELRRLFDAYYVGLPDESDRRIYFEEELESLFEHESVRSMRHLLEGTQGFDYVQLAALVRQIKMRIKYQILTQELSEEMAMDALDPEIVKEVLSMKEPEHSEEQVQTGGINAEELTAILKTVQAVQPVRTEPQQEKQQEKKFDSQADFREKFNPKMIFT